MTPFSLIIIFQIFYIFLKYRSLHDVYIALFAIGIFISINIEVGYFISIGSLYLTYSEFFFYLISLLSLIMLIYKKEKYSLSIIYSSSLLLLSIFITTVLLKVNTYEKDVILFGYSWDDFILGISNKSNIKPSIEYYKKILNPFLFTIVILVVSKQIKTVDWSRIIKIQTSLFKLLILYGCFELISKYLFHSGISYSFLNNFFGIVRNSFTELTIRGQGFVLQGFTTESSHYAFKFIFIFLTFGYNSIYLMPNKIWFYLAIIIFTLSMSFSTLLFGFSLLFLYVIYLHNRNGKGYFFLIATIILFALMLSVIIYILYISNSYYFNRIEKIVYELTVLVSGNTENTLLVGVSERARLLSIIDTIKIFYDRPMFGVGLGTVFSHGSFTIILSNIGLIGTIAWIDLLWFKYVNVNYKNKYYIIAMIFWFIVNIFVSNGINILFGLENLYLVVLFKLVYKNNSYNYVTTQL